MHDLTPSEKFGNTIGRGDTSLRVLLVEDNPGDARLFEEHLREGPVDATLRHEETLGDCLEVLGEEEPDVVVLDLGLPDSDRSATVRAVDEAAPEVPIVVLTGQADVGVSLAAQEAGATEYLQKQELGPALVGRTLRWAVQRHRMQAKLRQRDAWIRSITEGLSAGVFRTDPTGRIEYANEAMAQMLGFGQAERLVGQDLTTFYADPTDRGRMLAEEGASEVEIEFEGQGGSTFVGLLSATVAYDEHGAVLHYDGTVTDITDRVRRKERLRMLSEAVEQAKEAVLITEAVPLDEPGPRVEYVNAACEEMTGYSEEEMVGKTPRILQGPDTERDVLDSFRAALEAGEEWEGETVNYRKDGTPYRVQWNVSPVRGEDGEIEHWVSVQRDVTEEREREERLRRQNALLEQTQRLAGAWEVNLRTGHSTGSEEVYRILEVEEESEFTVEEGFQFFTPEARPKLREAFERCAEEGEPYDLELPLDTAKGNRRWVRTVGAPAEEEDGEVVKVAGAIQDITERKEAEEALREREEYLSVTLQSIGDAVVATDRDGCVTEMNAVAERLTGWDQEEAKGKLLDDILALHSARTGETVESPADEVLRDGTTVGLANHTVLTSRDGTEYQIADSAAPIRSEEDDLLGVVLVFRDVTENYERRRRMERQNDLFAKAQDLANVGAWEYDVWSGEATWTEEVYRIHGLPLDAEASPEQSLQFYHEEDRPVIEEAFARAVEEGAPYDLELRLSTAEGEERWIRTRGEPQTEDGDVVRVRGTIQDITERKRREIRLEEMQDRMELALDHTNSVVFEIDLEAGHVPRVGAYEKFFGMPSEAVDTREQFANRAVHPDDRADVRAFYRELAGGERTSGTLEYRTNPEFGDVRWIRDSVHRVEGEERLLGLARDVTSRKEQRERLRLLAEALEQVGDKVVITDREGRIEFVNEAFEHITGFGEEEVLGETPKVLQSGFHDDAFYRELWETILAGETFRAEMVNERKDGTTYVEDETISPVVDEDGDVSHFVSTGRDVTDRKEREQELKAAKEEAERMNRLKSAFLANMSHEIRTPLTSILGFAEMIGETVERAQETGEVDLPTLAEFSSLIERSGRRLMDTLTGVLNLSKLQAGEMTLDLGPVDLATEAEEAAEEFGPQAREAGIDLKTEAGGDPVWARADAGGLQIALRNLLSNAIKYTGEGGTVWVRTRQSGDMVAVEVKDTGIGMDPETAEGLFEAFKQASEGIGREYEGTGLGLTVTKEVLDQMGGSVEVETEEGEGSRFTVRLPRSEPSGEA